MFLLNKGKQTAIQHQIENLEICSPIEIQHYWSIVRVRREGPKLLDSRFSLETSATLNDIKVETWLFNMPSSALAVVLTADGKSLTKNAYDLRVRRCHGQWRLGSSSKYVAFVQETGLFEQSTCGLQWEIISLGKCQRKPMHNARELCGDLCLWGAHVQVVSLSAVGRIFECSKTTGIETNGVMTCASRASALLLQHETTGEPGGTEVLK